MVQWYKLQTTGTVITDAMKNEMESECRDGKKLVATKCAEWWYSNIPNFGYHVYDAEAGMKGPGTFRHWNGYKWKGIPYIKWEVDCNKLWPGVSSNFLTDFNREMKLTNVLCHQFDARHHINKIYTKNVVLTLEKDNTLTLSKPDPRNYNMSAIDIEYDNTKTCPVWDDLMNKIFGFYVDPKTSEYFDDDKWVTDTSLIKIFQEYIGYALQRGCAAEKFMLLIGSGGNGKSVVIKALSDILFGDTAGYSSLSSMSGNDNAVSELVDKLLIAHPDEPAVEWKKIDNTIKNLTNGEPISATRKYVKASNISITGKCLWGMNHYPNFSEVGHSIDRRMLAMPLNRQFTARDGTDATTDEILDKLRSEKQGMLNWALLGLIRLSGNDWKFTKSHAGEEEKRESIIAHDTIKTWMESCVKPTGKRHDVITTEELIESYIGFCVTYGIAPEFRKKVYRLAADVVKREPKIRKWRSSDKRGVAGAVLETSKMAV